MARRAAAIAASTALIPSQHPLSDPLVLSPFVVVIRGDWHPNEMAVAPAIEEKALLQRLAPGRDHHVIVLARRSGKRFCPMEFEGFELQRIQRNEQVFRPVKTVAPLSRPRLDEKVLQARRPDHALSARQPSRVGIGALS